MIAFVRTASIAPGKGAETMAFAKEMAAHIKKVNGVEVTVLTPIGGNPWRVAWSARYKDLGAMQVAHEKMLADKGYWELITKNADCFLAGSAHDAIWQEV